MRSDIGRPSTWKSFKPSLCSSCKAACCSLPVEVTLDDLLTLGLINQDEILGSSKKIFLRLKKEGVVQNFRAKTGLFTLSQKPDGTCIFLDNRFRCTVYSKRPRVCLQFPTQLGPRLNYCPYENVTK